MMKMSQVVVGVMHVLELVVDSWMPIQVMMCLLSEMDLNHGEGQVVIAQGRVTVVRCWSGYWSDTGCYVAPSQRLRHEKLMRPDKHCEIIRRY